MSNIDIPQSARPRQAGAILKVHPVTLLRWEKTIPGFPKPSRPTPRCTLYDVAKLIAFRDSFVPAEPESEVAA